MSEQVKIFLSQEKNQELLLKPGECLLPVLLDKLGQTVAGSFSPCAGGGKCGRCRVRFMDNPPMPTPTERVMLEPEELRRGVRLACLTRPVKDCTLDITALLEQMAKTRDYEIATQCTFSFPSAFREKKADTSPYLLAIDLGTTTIATALYERESGSVLTYAAAMNPQRKFGADVVSRMQAALEEEAYAKALQDCVWEQVGKLVEDTLQRAAVQKTVKDRTSLEVLRKQVKLVLAGNTTMVHLFLGLPVDTLAKAPFTPVTLAPAPMEFQGMSMEIVPGISAFVGGDIVAGMSACGILEKQAEDTFFLDLGTNAEMVYRRKDGQIVATAAAAGSAFEGSSDKSVYGSEAVHELARLLQTGRIDRSGTYRGETEATLSQQEIRNLQLAKAAVRAGMEILCEGSCPGKILLAGGFGRKLRIEDGIAIGLFPEEARGRILAVGNTALYGACLYGYLSEKTLFRERLRQVKTCNLAREPEFQQLFLRYCDFR